MTLRTKSGFVVGLERDGEGVDNGGGCVCRVVLDGDEGASVGRAIDLLAGCYHGLLECLSALESIFRILLTVQIRVILPV